jgi:porphobilinogen synthase
MPGVKRYTVDRLLPHAEACLSLGIPALALFPADAPRLKTPDGREAANPKGLIPRAVAALKKTIPRAGLDHGRRARSVHHSRQDGVLDPQGYVLNDETIVVLERQALACAAAGVDVVAPSDMMDGRVRAIRAALDRRGFIHTRILAYSAKYASAFYGPFRDAVGSAKFLGRGSKHTYQMDPGNSDEALWRGRPRPRRGCRHGHGKAGTALSRHRAQVKDEFRAPTFVYHVSGEYAMLKAAVQRGWLDERAGAWKC